MRTVCRVDAVPDVVLHVLHNVWFPEKQGVGAALAPNVEFQRAVIELLERMGGRGAELGADFLRFENRKNSGQLLPEFLENPREGLQLP